MNDVMTDIETHATSQGAVILSAAFVRFDRHTGETGEELFERFSITKGLNRERVTCESTVEFWSKQDSEIYERSKGGTRKLEDFLETDLRDFFTKKDKIWGNGATFDVSVLEHAIFQYRFNTLGMNSEKSVDYPWKYWNVRDVRTLMDLATGFSTKGKKPKELHDPIVDCKYQIGYVCKAIEVMRS